MKPTHSTSTNTRPHSSGEARTTQAPPDRFATRREERIAKDRTSFASLLAQTELMTPTQHSGSTSAGASHSSPACGLADRLLEQHRDLDLPEDVTNQIPAWVLIEQAHAEAGTPKGTSAGSSRLASSAPETNFGVMFDQFVSAVRIGKQGERACVSLTLDLGGTSPVQVMIEETSMGPMIEVQSENPTEGLALERALAKR